jgi:hypothetical protein
MLMQNMKLLSSNGLLHVINTSTHIGIVLLVSRGSDIILCVRLLLSEAVNILTLKLHGKPEDDTI